MTAYPYSPSELEVLRDRGDPPTTEVARLLATLAAVERHRDAAIEKANLHLSHGAEYARHCRRVTWLEAARMAATSLPASTNAREALNALAALFETKALETGEAKP